MPGRSARIVSFAYARRNSRIVVLVVKRVVVDLPVANSSGRAADRVHHAITNAAAKRVEVEELVTIDADVRCRAIGTNDPSPDNIQELVVPDLCLINTAEFH